MNFHIGQRLSFEKHTCTVRYIGSVRDTEGEWLGVEWNDVRRGRHDGWYKGQQYFQCGSKHPLAASFVRPSRKQDDPISFLDALRKKYVAEDTVHDVTNGTDTYFNGKLAEEIGFDKVRKKLSALQDLKIVILDSLCIQRPVSALPPHGRNLDDSAAQVQLIRSTCPNIRHLDLGQNLLEAFSDVVIIVSALDHLTKLDLSRNRFSSIQLSSEGDTGASTPVFPTVQELKLDQTMLAWDAVLSITRYFPNLKSLSVAGNELVKISTSAPNTIVSLDVSENNFKSLDDISALTQMESLVDLSLRGCSLENLWNNQQRSFQSVTSLNLADTRLSVETLYDIHASFPFLESLRCSGPDQSTSLILVARVDTLHKLNSSQITYQMRTNAELFYLNTVASELAKSPWLEDTVLSRHPRWDHLCRIHGRPANISHAHGGKQVVSLESNLLDISVYDGRKVIGEESERSQFDLRKPKSMSMHRLHMYAAQHLGISPAALKLSCATVRGVRTKTDCSGSCVKMQHSDEDLSDQWTIPSDFDSSEEDFDSTGGATLAHRGCKDSSHDMSSYSNRGLHHWIGKTPIQLLLEDSEQA